jgi:hypothetical protein
MERLQGAGNVVRKIAIITLTGFLIVVLSGPVLTLAGVLLPFALVGLLVWIPVQGFLTWKHGGWDAVAAAGKRTGGYVFAVPMWILSRVFGAVRWVFATVFGTVGFVLGLIFPVVAGAIGGAILGAIGGMEHQDAEFRIPAGLIIGALVGLLAGTLRFSSRPVKTVVVREIPAGLHQA